MTVTRFRIFHFYLQTLAGMFITFAAYAFTACSNSEFAEIDAEETDFSLSSESSEMDSTEQENISSSDYLQTSSSWTDSTIVDPKSTDSAISSEEPCDSTKDYLHPNDTEYPYVGLPRIVIATENCRAIKDRETEIPAQMQIWGEKAPESEIMELTIRGRGNTTWIMPKKPFTVKFDKKQPLLGMAKAKKWVLLANYLDRTLIRNAVALEIARKTHLEWSPSGKFAEIFLNGEFLGNYFVCEKIQIHENRLNISDASYLLEFDNNYDEEFKFKTSVRKLPVNIKDPDFPSQEQIEYITTYIDTIECILYGECKKLAIENYLDLQSFADYFIVYELTENAEPSHPKSVYMYKDAGTLKAGPVWDFDWETFVDRKKAWGIKNGVWYNALLKHNEFKKLLQNSWNQYKSSFENIKPFIDSLAEYTRSSNERNIELWPIIIPLKNFPDKDKSFDEAISMMKSAYSKRLLELDSLLNGTAVYW